MEDEISKINYNNNIYYKLVIILYTLLGWWLQCFYVLVIIFVGVLDHPR